MRLTRNPLAILAVLFVVLLGGWIFLRVSNPRIELLGSAEPRVHGNSRELFVVMHSWQGTPEKLRDVIATIERTHPDADIMAPQYASGLFSNADPWALSVHLDESIQRATVARTHRPGGGYDRIVLVGHSAGALLLRKAYVFARGSREDAGVGTSVPARTWPALVTRFIMLAGLNRGWTLIPRPPERPLYRQVLYRAFHSFATTTGVGGFVLNMERGSPFVANLRVQWIRLLQTADVPMPAVYQLLGREDGVVSPEDSQDLVGMPAFQTITVLGAHHGDIIRFGAGAEGANRREKFEEALVLEEFDLAKAYAPADTTRLAEPPPALPTPAEPTPAPPTGPIVTSTPAATTRMLSSSAIPYLGAASGTGGSVRPVATRSISTMALSPTARNRLLLSSRFRPERISEQTRVTANASRLVLAAKYQRPSQIDPEVATARSWNAAARLNAKPRKYVVFVLHGIRDNGEFANEFRRLIEARSQTSHDSVEVLTDRYDRFALLPFLLFNSRQKQVRWFMDRYTDALARSPGATFSFIGHSNGTYVLASALETYKTMSMRNVVFAGSVVPRRFDWNALATGPNPRVERLLNVRAAGDVVVAVFPRFYEFIYEHSRLGWFRDIGSAGFSGFEEDFGNRNEIAFVRGGHGAALHEPNSDQLVDFALTGQCVPAAFNTQSKADGWVEMTSGLCGLVWLLLIGILVGVAWLILRIPRLAVRITATLLYAVVLIFVLFNV